MKAMRRKALLSALVLSLILAYAPAANLQVVYTTRDSIYQRVESLCMRAGVIGPSSFSPMSARALIIALDRIDRAALSDADRLEYDRLHSILTGEEHTFSADHFSLDVSSMVNIGVNIADYSDFDYGNTALRKPAYDHREDTIVPYRYEAPLLGLNLNLGFGDNVVLEGQMEFKNPGLLMYESTLGFLATSVTGTKGMAADWPYRAGGSIGNDYISLIFGRYPHGVGSGKTGNLVIGDNFSYQEVINASFMSNYFSYNISVTRFDLQETKNEALMLTEPSRSRFSGDQQFRVLHRFDVNILDKARLALDLATIYCSSNGLDYRFFYPFVVSHNYYNYTNGIPYTTYDEANNFMALEAEWNITRGLAVSAQFAIDQFQMPWEDASALPLAFGVLGNIKYSTRAGNGHVDTWFETVYTNPYLYLNGKRGQDGRVFYNLDYIVGYGTKYFSEFGYSGYVYGPDSIVFSLGADYRADDGSLEAGGSILYRIQGEKGIRLYAQATEHTIIDMSDAVIENDSEEFMKNIWSPSGGWKSAEHLVKLTAYGRYNFERQNWGRISIYAALGANIYANYNREAGRNEFQPQMLIGVAWVY